MQLRVKDVKRESKNSFSLILEKPTGFSFYPGQFLDIGSPRGGVGRIFSISSSPTEDFIMLTCKITSSSFNKKLRSLKEKDLVSSSHPAGTVVIDDSSPLVLMPGGIGITPHRSMIKWAVDRKLNLPITLIYSNSDSDFIFKEELDFWQKQYPKLEINYIITGKDGRLDELRFNKLYPKPYTLNPIFYLAGPPAMVDDFEEILLKLGVDSTSIRTDRFDGL